jgi:hypothetical protein
MKLLIAVLLFAAQAAMADMTCDAHEIMAGNSGRTGTMVMGSNPFSLKWAGDTADLIGKGMLCGVALNASTVCETKDHSSGPTIAARMTCKDGAKSPFENNVGEGYFVYSEANGVGRFGCSNVSGAEKVDKLVEINNCR